MANEANELERAAARLTAENDLTDEDLEAQLAYEHFKQRREARKRKRILIGAAIAVVALVALVVFVARQTNDASDQGEYDPFAATAMVYRDDFATTVSANGATEPLSSTVVTPEVEGIIENVQVEEGSYVEAGTTLFSVKNEDYDKAVREANAQVASAERAARLADRSVDDAYAAYSRAWTACRDAGDWSDFDRAGLDAAIDSSEASYEDALVAVENAKLALGEAQETAGKRTVRAPVSGSVVAMNAVNGAATGSSGAVAGASSGPLVQISDLSQMKVTVQVNEVDIASISVGQTARATFSALPGVESEATVQRIASVATGSGEGGYGAYGGVVTYAVDLLIPNPDPKLKPGMTATVTITTQSAPDSLIVPASAVWEGAGAARYVTVLVDGEAGQTRDVAVEVVEENSSEAAVKGALEEGDLVLLGGGLGGLGDDLEGFSANFVEGDAALETYDAGAEG